MDILLPEYKNLLAILVKYEVDFMLVGGYAVISTDMSVLLQTWIYG